MRMRFYILSSKYKRPVHCGRETTSISACSARDKLLYQEMIDGDCCLLVGMKLS